MGIKKNYYEILGVRSIDPKSKIKKTFKRLIHFHHPDKKGDKEKALELIEAYENLVDEDKRRVHDSRHGLNTRLKDYSLLENPNFSHESDSGIEIMVNNILEDGKGNILQEYYGPSTEFYTEHFAAKKDIKVWLISGNGILYFDISDSNEIIFDGKGSRPYSDGNKIIASGFDGAISLPTDINVNYLVKKSGGLISGILTQGGIIRSQDTDVDLRLMHNVKVVPIDKLEEYYPNYKDTRPIEIVHPNALFVKVVDGNIKTNYIEGIGPKR